VLRKRESAMKTDIEYLEARLASEKKDCLELQRWVGGRAGRAAGGRAGGAAAAPRGLLPAQDGRRPAAARGRLRRRRCSSCASSSPSPGLRNGPCQPGTPLCLRLPHSCPDLTLF